MPQVAKEHRHWSQWFPGSEDEWRALPWKERYDLSFKATGCQVAYPTWTAPVDCVHTHCLVRRGEKPPIYITNCALRAEARGSWLRFLNRKRLAYIYRAVRAAARKSGIYDPWEIPGGWQVMVFGGLGVLDQSIDLDG